MKCILNKNIPSEISEYFKSKNIEIIYTKSIRGISDVVRYHPDIQCFVLKDTIITSPALFDYYNKFLKNTVKSKKELHSPYPSDVLFNCFILEKTIYGNLNYIDETVKDAVKKNNMKFIHVKQGYANCSSVAISKNAVITSDKGMEKIFIKNNVDTLFIDNKKILLKGCDYGFIGGASCRLDDEIIFFGNIKEQPDFDRIDIFLKKYNISYKNFSFPLEDFGSALFLE